MPVRYAYLLSGLVVFICAIPGDAWDQKDDPKDFDRITPLVRVVQKCQGAVVAFMNPETGKPMGTGIIVDGRGFIVTNSHVVGSKKSLKIQLIDKTELDANVLAVNRGYDLAIAKISSTKKLDTLPPTASDRVYVGEEVIAIGHPYGYSYSITRGILSATGRKIPLPNGTEIVDVYQTDAAINPGNSGGPLMNIHGELIAVNFATRDGASNISFCIPAKRVREVLVEVMK
jgi:serine protease Do